MKSKSLRQTHIILKIICFSTFKFKNSALSQFIILHIIREYLVKTHCLITRNINQSLTITQSIIRRNLMLNKNWGTNITISTYRKSIIHSINMYRNIDILHVYYIYTTLSKSIYINISTTEVFFCQLMICPLRRYGGGRILRRSCNR